MSSVSVGQLPSLAAALAKAYPTSARASELFASINESFDMITDPNQPHPDRIEDAVADLAGRGLLLLFMDMVLKDPQQKTNIALRHVLEPICQENKWQRLNDAGLVLRLGPFVDRINLRQAIDRLCLGRKVLRIFGTNTGARGRSWSSQLIERQAALRGARYVHVDLRIAPAEGREKPSWLATHLLEKLLPPPAPSISSYVENRLVEPLLVAWVPTAVTHLLVIDHGGDANVAPAVREYIIALTLAAAESKLPGLKLILIDGPSELDLSRHSLQIAEDVVGPVTLDHLKTFFSDAAEVLFPDVSIDRRQEIADATVLPLAASLPQEASEDFAIAVRDALEAMALTLTSGLDNG